MKTHLNLTLLCAVFLFTGCKKVKENAFTPINSDTLMCCIQQVIDKYDIPAMAVSIFTADKVLNQEAIGLRELGTENHVQLTDKFHLGSNGKAITSFVAGRLVEKGVLNWDSKFFDRLPELKDSANVAYYNITLSNLLSHTARLQPFTSGEDFEMLPEFSGDNVTNRRYVFAKWLLRQHPVELNDSVSFVYSNAGFGLAALMMEKATGEIWNDIINEELFQPLGIDVTIGWPASADSTHILGHFGAMVDNQHSLIPIPHDYEGYELDDLLTPTGNYSMSIFDYTKFLQQHLAGINNVENLLSPQTYDYMHYHKLDANATPSDFSYSMGWGAYKYSDSITVSFHNGSGGTFYCKTELYKEPDLGIVIITNSADSNAKEGIAGIKKYILKYYNL